MFSELKQGAEKLVNPNKGIIKHMNQGGQEVEGDSKIRGNKQNQELLDKTRCSHGQA